MADRLKDTEDLKLDALFSSEPVPDDGFSKKVVWRVRRQIWVQRLSLPLAIGIGAILAAKPFLELVGLVPKVLTLVPQGITSLVDLPLENLPPLSTIALAVLLLAVTLMVGRFLEE